MLNVIPRPHALWSLVYNHQPRHTKPVGTLRQNAVCQRAPRPATPFVRWAVDNAALPRAGGPLTAGVTGLQSCDRDQKGDAAPTDQMAVFSVLVCALALKL